jgi:hypothetical protein
MDPRTDETSGLRRLLRDLVGLSALPPVWVGYGSAQIAESLADVLLRTLHLDLLRSLHPVAEALTGWTQDQAAGRPLSAVFRIFHETTREPVEDPVARVLREGLVAGRRPGGPPDDLDRLGPGGGSPPHSRGRASTSTSSNPWIPPPWRSCWPGAEALPRCGISKAPKPGSQGRRCCFPWDPGFLVQRAVTA